MTVNVKVCWSCLGCAVVASSEKVEGVILLLCFVIVVH